MNVSINQKLRNKISHGLRCLRLKAGTKDVGVELSPASCRTLSGKCSRC